MERVNMEIIIILMMLFCELMFIVLPNVIRYNSYESEKWILLVMLSYSIIWVYCVLRDDGSQWIMSCIYLAGVFQGIVGIIENRINKKKYQGKDEFIRTFEKNTFIILSFDMLEKYTVGELKLLKKLNEENKGRKCRNILLIQKDEKKDKVMLMFFLRKMTNNLDIKKYCEKNYDIVEIGENKGKQAVVCYLK